MNKFFTILFLTVTSVFAQWDTPKSIGKLKGVDTSGVAVGDVIVWRGDKWVDTAATSVGGGGDITAVVAGNGIVGGATSGSATVSVDTADTFRWLGTHTNIRDSDSLIFDLSTALNPINLRVNGSSVFSVDSTGLITGTFRLDQVSDPTGITDFNFEDGEGLEYYTSEDNDLFFQIYSLVNNPTVATTTMYLATDSDNDPQFSYAQMTNDQNGTPDVVYEFFGNQAIFEKPLQIAIDADTLKLNLGVTLNAIDLEINNTTLFSVDTTGVVLIGSTLDASATMAGSDAFTTTATTDTVTIAGAANTDLYYVTLSVAAAPGATDAFSVEATTTGFVVHRGAAGTNGLTYRWLRLKP